MSTVHRSINNKVLSKIQEIRHHLDMELRQKINYGSDTSKIRHSLKLIDEIIADNIIERTEYET